MDPLYREQVLQINLAIASNAQEFILGESHQQIAKLVDATGAKERKWMSSFGIFVPADDDGARVD
jgi:hypothetical protein